MFIWALPPNVGGTAQRYRQAIGQFVGARSLVCRRGAQVNRHMEDEVGALERREGQESVRCRKTSARGAKVTEILGMGCSTLRLACSEGIQLVDLTGVLWRLCCMSGLLGPARLWCFWPYSAPFCAPNQVISSIAWSPSTKRVTVSFALSPLVDLWYTLGRLITLFS
jgi:hypothetical protein